MEKISIIIDDKNVIATRGSTILETALLNKIYIPHLCYHPDLKPAGSCRLCLVELDNGHVVTSCRTKVKEGMRVKTNTDLIDKIRRPIVEMIVANHHMDCKNCPKKGQCQLQRIMAFMKIDKNRVRRLRLPDKEIPIDDSNPFFYRDHNKCVLCGICVRTCQEIVGMNSIDFAGRGINTKISTFGDKPIAESNCILCGECVVRCPVGALIIKDFSRPINIKKTVCSYCGLGCGIEIGIKDDKIVNVYGDTENTQNNGLLCVKGRFGTGFLFSRNRLTRPLVKRKDIEKKAIKKDSIKDLFEETSWDSALRLIAKKFKKINGEEFAVITSNRCTNEDNYVIQKFARVAMKSNNIDSFIRLFDAPSLYALIETNTIKRIKKINFEDSLSILNIGTDVTVTHPVLSMKIKRAVSKGVKLVTISNYETDLNIYSDIFLKPHPGTESALIMGICKQIVDENSFDMNFVNNFCEGYEEFLESLENFTPGRVERITGVSRESIEEVAKIISKDRPVTILWDSNITRYINATNNVYSIINLSLLLKGDLLPLWEKNNTFGTSLAGCLPDYYPFFKPSNIKEVDKFVKGIWKTELTEDKGLTLYEILEKAVEGKIKALYIIGSDVASYISPDKLFKNALKKAKLIVVQDILLSEICKYADIILPVKSGVEKNGTIVSTGSKTQNINRIFEGNDQRLSDWEVICELAKTMEIGGFDFKSEEDIKKEISLFNVDVIQDDVKCKFKPVEFVRPSEETNIDYPLMMVFKKNKFVDGIMSSNVEGLNKLAQRRVVYISPKDAYDFNIDEDNFILIESRWGKIHANFNISDLVPPGILLADLPNNELNKLLNPDLDIISKTPETKICAVRLKSTGKKKKGLQGFF